MASNAGKGSGRRPSEVTSEVIESNWDRIFGKKDKNVGETIQRYSEPIPEREYKNNWIADKEQSNG